MDASHHLSRTLLDAYFQGDASEADLLSAAIRALENDCATCRGNLGASGVDYSRAARRARERYRANVRELQAERRHLPELLQDLAGATASAAYNDFDTLLHVAGERRFHTAAFVSYQLAAGWQAADAEDRPSAALARDLADASATRLDGARYGRPLVAQLRGETELLRARLALAEPAAPVAYPGSGEVEAALQAAAALVPAAASTDLAIGVETGKACAALRAGDRFLARRHLDEASRLASHGAIDRWRLGRETLLARLERRAGEPEQAVQRLTGLFEAAERAPAKVWWTAARERVKALVALGGRQEAQTLVTRWQIESTNATRADLDHLQAITLSIDTSPDALQLAATELRAAWAAHLARGHAIRASTAILDLLRVRPRHSTRTLAIDLLDMLIACCDLPAPALATLTSLARSLHDPESDHATDLVDRTEDTLFALDPPWSPTPDGPAA